MPAPTTWIRELWERRLPLTPKALLLTGFVGIVSWFLLEHIQGARLAQLFNDYLVADLQENVQSDRIWLNHAFEMQSQALKLISRGDKLLAQAAALSMDGEPAVIQHDLPPDWLPPLSILRKMTLARSVLLLDRQGRPREVYSASLEPEIPTLLSADLPLPTENDIASLILTGHHNHYLYIIAALPDANRQIQGYLALATPLDNTFLITVQHHAHSKGIAVFIDRGAILATSRPDQVPVGTSLATLDPSYLILGKAFFDYGFYSDVTIHFATLIPRQRIADLSQSVLSGARLQRAAGHLLLLLVFLLLVISIARHIEGFTGRIIAFSREHLHLEPPQGKVGNQLYIMSHQFERLAQEVVQAWQRDQERTAELEMANHALEESLAMVKRTQAQLIQSEKMAALGKLVAGIAHEINTPVGIGVTSASHLEQKTEEFLRHFKEGQLKRTDLENYLETAQEASSMILSNMYRAAELIRNFKQVAVDQSSQARRPFDLGEYISQVLLSLRPKLKSTTHAIRVHCPPGLIIENDPGAFSQILTNLILNSLTHAFEPGESGTITIEVSHNQETLEIIYSDDGRGMTPDERQRIYEPFFTTRRNLGGSGLGMHIVFNLVAQTLKGTIQCQSDPGQGTRFTMRMPLYPEPIETPAPQGTLP